VVGTRFVDKDSEYSEMGSEMGSEMNSAMHSRIDSGVELEKNYSECYGCERVK